MFPIKHERHPQKFTQIGRSFGAWICLLGADGKTEKIFSQMVVFHG